MFSTLENGSPKIKSELSLPSVSARESASSEQLWLRAGAMEAPSSTELLHAVCIGRALL